MRTLWTSLKKNKTLFLFITILFFFGVLTGVLFYFKQDLSTRETLSLSLTNLFQENVFPYKNIFYHFVLLLFLVASLFCFIGVPLLVFYIFFEGISLGFILPLFFSLFKINAFVNFLLYFVLIKFIFLFLLFFLFIKSCQFMRVYMASIKKKNYVFMKNLKYIVILILFILINDVFVYFVSNRLLILLLG